MTTIAIVYHSGQGHTKELAQHIQLGIAAQNCTAHMLSIPQANDQLEILNQAEAIIFGSPTYMGSVSAQFKTFMEATSPVWLQQKWANKFAAGFTTSLSMSGDKLNTLIQMTIFAAQHGMVWIGQSHMDASPNNQRGASHAVNRLGSALGLMAQSDDDSPLITPPNGDRHTAFLLGERVAFFAKKMPLKA